jgi:hypothetical protein
VSKSGWHNLHLTEDRALAIVGATLQACGCGAEGSATYSPDDLPGIEERALRAGLEACKAIKYPPKVRGALGGHAKHGTKPGEKPRQEEARAARREQARQRKLEEEYRIGKVPVGRAIRLGGDTYWAEEKVGR